jgi:hypothetical protein
MMGRPRRTIVNKFGAARLEPDRTILVIIVLILFVIVGYCGAKFHFTLPAPACRCPSDLGL